MISVSWPRGFTLVELLMVMVLLGILAAAATSLYAGRSDFEVRAGQDFVINAVREAQQVAMARTADSSVQLRLVYAGGLLSSQILAQSGSGFSSQTDLSSELYGGTDLAASCASLASTPLQLAFDGNGQLTIGQSYRLCAPAGFEVCISASGYAYAGSCL
ncbi:pilus assembly FimT family protein [Oceanobacter mangrovi]|uniref:pilus assembly FimT family protein n=1 Tax=Oceanobacter mangrovi TaxID=2862510 RepID=UPI001C8D9C32|nr:prepilin-type N-terminal cleavage/methylation domain-containing protein [Oceanobacter mangrovi]